MNFRRAVAFGPLALSLALAGIGPGIAGAQTDQQRAPATSASDDVARGLFQAGKAAYEAGNYEDALDFFEQAYERSGRPELLFNIGQAADRLRRDEKAIEALRGYLTQLPEASNRAEVEARIRALEQAVAERKRAAEADVPAAPTPAETAERAARGHDDRAFTDAPSAEPRSLTERWWFWTGLGVVVVGGTAALALALSGSDAGRAPFYEGNGGSLSGP